MVAKLARRPAVAPESTFCESEVPLDDPEETDEVPEALSDELEAVWAGMTDVSGSMATSEMG